MAICGPIGGVSSTLQSPREYLIEAGRDGVVISAGRQPKVWPQLVQKRTPSARRAPQFVQNWSLAALAWAGITGSGGGFGGRGARPRRARTRIARAAPPMPTMNVASSGLASGVLPESRVAGWAPADAVSVPAEAGGESA